MDFINCKYNIGKNFGNPDIFKKTIRLLLIKFFAVIVDLLHKDKKRMSCSIK